MGVGILQNWVRQLSRERTISSESTYSLTVEVMGAFAFFEVTSGRGFRHDADVFESR